MERIKTPTITVVIHTYNEEQTINECVKSAHLLSDDIILVDMQSMDKTVQNAKRAGISKDYQFPHSLYVEPARQFGIQKAKGQWVFILDADERITPELAKEIKLSISTADYTYYKVPRKNIFAGTKWLKHGGWWPDYQTRLLKKSAFINWIDRIHATPKMKGTLSFLEEPYVHYFHPNLENMVKKTAIYENIEAELLYKANRGTNTVVFFRKFTAELYRRLLQKMGFLDGPLGIIESYYQAYSKTITWLLVHEKKVLKNTPL